MRSAKRIRYYCDFCKRVSGRIDTMKVHEEGCTGNPDRHCRMCDLNCSVQHTPRDMAYVLGGGTNKEFSKLCDLVENCPACVLSAIRLWNKTFDKTLSLEAWTKRKDMNDWSFKEAKDIYFGELPPDQRMM